MRGTAPRAPLNAVSEPYDKSLHGASQRGHNARVRLLPSVLYRLTGVHKHNMMQPFRRLLKASHSTALRFAPPRTFLFALPPPTITARQCAHFCPKDLRYAVTLGAVAYPVHTLCMFHWYPLVDCSLSQPAGTRIAINVPAAVQ